ncbi:signal recognition particle-docking protein FtsY [Cyanobium gracile UHCC 0139]|uniref:Signal recognition particle receptor FtsY n=1 Tax=Cyanobium gracile UHCC 0139 TaxID=3110308 RepID=A0ABU5RQX5_9CYAN|nr:signal recognition particle-docking protein FtsY [Cyanobium gracile]MEA5390181.1 signal recognition particle-docking protein FtsY [Cyanobium gracile UHCC 0139]
MVFDWFKRALAQPAPAPAAAPTPAPPPEPEPPAEPEAATVPAEPEAAAPVAVPPSEAAPAVAAAAPPPAPATPAGPGVDEDALAWARQAYARLKAQQEAASQATAPAPSPAPAPAAEAPPAPVAEAPPAPEADPEPTAATAPEHEPAPEPAAPPVASGLSLLEQAAAQRQQRLQEITAPAEPAPVAPPAAATPATPAATPTAPEADAADPSLGAFDDTFTWSAEVLAAQGRSVEEVSLEEIDWLGRLRRGLEKTRKGFVTQLLENLGDDPLTPAVLDDLESTLLRADVGVKATDQVLEALRRRLNEEVVDPAEGLRFLKEQLRGLLEEPIRAGGTALLAPQRDRLNVWLLVGVNGVGKTTTLGKLANLAVRSGYSCLIAAADTFRAAAVQQVSVWGERSGVAVVANPSANADPAAVVFDAIGAARSKGTELVLVDTAGRLQTKHNLMEELGKVRRTITKLAPEAAVESLLVLDASQGQNGLRQAMAFASAAGLTGVVLTKLDGSARGGVALAVASEAGLPIRFIGAGEGIRDLRPFNSFEFVEALLAS